MWNLPLISSILLLKARNCGGIRVPRGRRAGKYTPHPHQNSVFSGPSERSLVVTGELTAAVVCDRGGRGAHTRRGAADPVAGLRRRGALSYKKQLCFFKIALSQAPRNEHENRLVADKTPLPAAHGWQPGAGGSTGAATERPRHRRLLQRIPRHHPQRVAPSRAPPREERARPANIHHP